MRQKEKNLSKAKVYNEECAFTPITSVRTEAWDHCILVIEKFTINTILVRIHMFVDCHPYNE